MVLGLGAEASFWAFIVLFFVLGCASAHTIGYVYRRWLLPKSWPYDIIIREKRGNSTYHVLDMAQIWKDTRGVLRCKLKRSGRIIKPPKFDYINKGEKGRGLIDLYSPNRDEFLLTQFVGEDKMHPKQRAKIKIIPEDIRFWDVVETQDDFKRWKPMMSAFEKAAPIIVLVIIMTAGVLAMTYNQEMVANSVAQIAGAQERSIDKIDELMRWMGKDIEPKAEPPDVEGMAAPIV